MSATDIGDILAMVRDIKESNTCFESKLLELDEKVKLFELLKVKVDQVVKGVNELKERDRSLKLAEIDAKRYWLVVKGMKFHQDATNYETRTQTRDVLEAMFKFMGVNIELADYFRVQSRGGRGASGRSGQPGQQQQELNLTKIRFISIDDKLLLFSKVAELGKDGNLRHISFQDDLPNFLVKTFKELDKVAYDLRKAEGVKTRIVTRGVDLILQQKVNPLDQGGWEQSLT